MPVKRRRAKARTEQITPEALAAFRDMEAADAADDDEAWWGAHGRLHRELNLSPWEWPAVEYPDAINPYPEGSHAARHWDRTRAERPEAFRRYRALKAALAEADASRTD